METSLRDLRKEANLTQSEVANMSHISLRSYQSYENDESKRDTITYDYLVRLLDDLVRVDEENGLLTIEDIKEGCQRVLSKYDVKCAYLYGSYAKGHQKENSDVDLFIISEETGLRYFGLIEELREELHKRVEIVTQRKMKNDPDFLFNEVLTCGIKVYEQQ